MAIARYEQFRQGGARERGFTLVELIAVVVIAGIIGVAAMGRFFDRNTYDARNFADTAEALLRHGQKVAILQNRNVFIRLNGAGITLCYQPGCGAGQRVLAPGGGHSNSAATRAACPDTTWACEAPPAGVELGPTIQFYFDPLGKPFAITDSTASPVSTFAQLAVLVTAGATTRTITVERETGYVH